jgi:hypothetical protein
VAGAAGRQVGGLLEGEHVGVLLGEDAADGLVVAGVDGDGLGQQPAGAVA